MTCPCRRALRPTRRPHCRFEPEPGAARSRQARRRARPEHRRGRLRDRAYATESAVLTSDPLIRRLPQLRVMRARWPRQNTRGVPPAQLPFIGWKHRQGIRKALETSKFADACLNLSSKSGAFLPGWRERLGGSPWCEKWLGLDNFDLGPEILDGCTGRGQQELIQGGRQHGSSTSRSGEP